MGIMEDVKKWREIVSRDGKVHEISIPVPPVLIFSIHTWKRIIGSIGRENFKSAFGVDDKVVDEIENHE